MNVQYALVNKCCGNFMQSQATPQNHLSKILKFKFEALHLVADQKPTEFPLVINSGRVKTVTLRLTPG